MLNWKKKPPSTFTENDDFFYGCSMHTGLPNWKQTAEWTKHSVYGTSISTAALILKHRWSARSAAARVVHPRYEQTRNKPHAIHEIQTIRQYSKIALLAWRISKNEEKNKFLANKWVIAVILHVAQIEFSLLAQNAVAQSVSQFCYFPFKSNKCKNAVTHKTQNIKMKRQANSNSGGGGSRINAKNWATHTETEENNEYRF